MGSLYCPSCLKIINGIDVPSIEDWEKFKECGRKLKYNFYDIGGKEYCKACALEFISDIREFKVNLNQNGGKNGY